MTFGEAAQGALELRLKRFRSHHTVRQWKTDLFDRLSDWQEKPIKDLSRKDVIKVLRPVVNKTPESGRRFRTRIEAVFSYAIGLEEYEGQTLPDGKMGLPALYGIETLRLIPLSIIRRWTTHLFQNLWKT